MINCVEFKCDKCPSVARTSATSIERAEKFLKNHDWLVRNHFNKAPTTHLCPGCKSKEEKL